MRSRYPLSKISLLIVRAQVLQLSRHLFRLFALSLDLDENYFDSMMTHPGGIARLIYYPPQKEDKLAPTEQEVRS